MLTAETDSGLLIGIAVSACVVSLLLFITAVVAYIRYAHILY